MSTVESSLSTLETKIAFQVNWIEFLLAKLRAFFTPDTCRRHMSLFRVVGHTGIVVAGVLGVLCSIVAAIKSDSLFIFLLGIGWLIGILIVDYVSRRFEQTADSLVKSTKSYLSSTVYVEAIALLLLVASAGLFGIGIYGAIKSASIAFFLKSAGLSVWMFYVSLIALNAASMLNIEFKEGLKAEEEGVGLLEFNAKSCLLAVPFYFGAGIVFGLIHLLWSVIKLTREETFASALSDSTSCFVTLGIVAALPLLACLAFLVLYALIAAVKSLIRMASVLEKKEG